MWLIVRQQPKKAGWWDAPFTLRDLAEAISITRSKVSYSLIEPQPLLCTPACGYKPHALVVHSRPTFTAPPVGSIYGNRSKGLWWSFFAETVYMLRPLAVFAEEFHRWCLTEFWMWLCLRRRFPPLGLHREILNSSCVLILLIHTKHKYKKMKSWTDPTYSFPSRRTHPLSRQGRKRVTNSRAAAHKTWMVKCSSRTPGF